MRYRNCLLLLFFISGVQLLLPIQAIASPGKLRVGVIFPLSGDAASAGEAMRNGMTLAYEGLPEETRKKLELDFEDDQLKPSSTISAFRRLTSSNNIDVVVNASSGTCNALAPVAEQAKIPLIAIATDPKVVLNRHYVVNFWITPEEEVRVLLPEAVKRGYKRIARIASIQDFTLAVKEYFDIANKGKIEVVLDEEYSPENKDFRTYLTKLRDKKNIDAVMVSLMPGHLGAFAKQAKQMGITLPIFGFETLEDSNEVKLSEGALVGQWYVNTDDPNDLFLNKFKERFPNSSLFGASNAHDIVLLLAKAAEEGMSREEVNSFLHNLKNFSGALGVYSATGDNRFTLPATVKVVTADGFKKLYK